MVEKIFLISIGYLIATVIDMYLYTKENYEYFVWNPMHRDLSKCKNIQIEENGEFIDGELLLYASRIIRGVTMIKISELDSGKVVKEKIEICKKLVPEDGILIRTELPEGFSTLRIEWIDNNFYKCSLNIEYDGKNGNIREVPFYKITIMTFIHSLFTGKLIRDLIRLFM